MDGKVLSLLHKTYSATNPENFSSLGQILFSMAKITGFEKTSFEFTISEILKIKL